jgi:hypothetical protein
VSCAITLSLRKPGAGRCGAVADSFTSSNASRTADGGSIGESAWTTSRLTNTAGGNGERREEGHENTAVLSLASATALAKHSLSECSHQGRRESDLLGLKGRLLSVSRLPRTEILGHKVLVPLGTEIRLCRRLGGIYCCCQDTNLGILSTGRHSNLRSRLRAPRSGRTASPRYPVEASGVSSGRDTQEEYHDGEPEARMEIPA